MQNSDARSQRVVDFLQVLKLFVDEPFGDAYYDINYWQNINLSKPMNLPKDEDVSLLTDDECYSIMSFLNAFEYPSDTFVSLRTVVATVLIIFNARRGREPVHLQFTINEKMQ